MGDSEARIPPTDKGLCAWALIQGHDRDAQPTRRCGPRCCILVHPAWIDTLADVTALPDVALLSHAVELAPDGIMIVSPQGEIIYANQSMHTMAMTDQMVGRSVDEFVPDDYRDRHTIQRSEYHNSPGRRRPMGSDLNLVLRRDDGTTLPVDISLSPFDHADGRYVITVVRDVSDRVEHISRLTVATEQLALVAERERIGRDLHDVVLQHLYGMGLSVQAIATGSPEPIHDRLDAVIDDIDRIIAEVRTIVFTLGSSTHTGTLGQELADVVAQASRVLGFTPSLRLDGPVESALSDEVCTELVASMREALGNVARHAHASRAEVNITVANNTVQMLV
ncbi:MAG: hypothetical protein CSA55_00535, partial [Ilumatobacter coccineus]